MTLSDDTRARPAQILVLAGTNGAGKSSIGGKQLRKIGVEYFNPDVATKAILAAKPGMPLGRANSLAWREGKRLLETAIREHIDYTFETTLGGKTITRLLEQAAANRLDVRIWYAGLDSPERHIARVRARVARGGHDIPEGKVRARYDSSRTNLATLIPSLAALSVYDNSGDVDPLAAAPKPRLVLQMQHGEIVHPAQELLGETPEWARSLVCAAMRCHLAAADAR